MQLFEWMLNRIERTLKELNAQGVLICDEGNEQKLTTLVRRLKKVNPIPNKAEFDMQGIGHDRNMPFENIIEDPLFKTSKSSYFIQLADFLAFSLLRNEKPLPQTLAKVNTAFDQLDKVLVKKAFSTDRRKKGIIRL